jgi:hypothetical protein
MVVARVSFGSWPIEFNELNKMLLEVQIGNSLCAFHLIRIILNDTNNFPYALQDSTTDKPTLFIVEVPLNLPVPLISIPPIVIPS